MDGADVFCHKACLRQVGGSLESYGKGVEARPIGFGARVVFDAHFGIFLCNGGDERRVESARQEHTVGYIGHELTTNGSIEGLAQL